MMSRLNQSLWDPHTGQTIRGRELVDVVCGACGGTVVGKVFSGQGFLWLTTHRLSSFRFGRDTGGPRPRAEQVTRSSLIHGPQSQREVWCKKHGRRPVDILAVLEAVDRANELGQIRRVVV